MAVKSVKGLAIRTERDEKRERDKEALALEWARVDAMLDDALHDAATILPTSTNEVS